MGKINLNKLITLDIQNFYNKTIRNLHTMFRHCLNQIVQELLSPYNLAAGCSFLPKEKIICTLPTEKISAYLSSVWEHNLPPSPTRN